MDDRTRTSESAHDFDFVTPWAPEPDRVPEVVVVDLTQPDGLGLVVELRQAFAKIDLLAEEVSRLREQLNSAS